MDIKGKLNVFVKDVTAKDGTEFKSFRASVSGKVKDSDKYLNASVKVRFAGEKFPKSKTDKLESKYMYVIDVVKGFISVEEFKTTEKTYNDLVLVITDAKIDSKKEITQKKKQEEVTDDDLPF